MEKDSDKIIENDDTVIDEDIVSDDDTAYESSVVSDDDTAYESSVVSDDELAHEESVPYEDYVIHEDDAEIPYEITEDIPDDTHEDITDDTQADEENRDTQISNEESKIDEAVHEGETADKESNGSIISKIRARFDDLDMITISAIAIMISDTNARASSPYIEGMRKADIRDMLYTFLQDTYHATDINQIDSILDKKYYKRIIRKYLGSTVVYITRGISDSLPGKNMWFMRRMLTASKRRNIYIDKICDSLKSFETVKYIPALSGNQEVSISKKNYKLDHLSDYYKDALIYLTDILLTCTCISKMIFVERMIRKIPADSEFARIIENITESINDINIIINKSRPLYKQFYQAQLGHINGDDLLYGMAVTIMVNSIKRTGIMNKDLLKLEFSFDNAGELTNNMMLWLDFLAKYDYTTDIGSLILQRISLLVKGNSDLLLAGLGEFLNLEDFFEKRIAYYRKLRDKERYLKGDLTKEVLEMTSLSDITDDI